MTRFQKEISGLLGTHWVFYAKQELDKIQKQFNEGKITVDANGILRNSIGRVAVEDVCEKCEYLGIKFDSQATEEARAEELHKAVQNYRENHKNGPTNERINELRAAFGRGTTVIDIFTGTTIKL